TIVDAIPPATTTTFPGGVLAQPTNTGRFHHGDCGVIPEFTANLGWRITPWLQGTIGYNFLYVNNLARVGAQIDAVDGRQVFSSAAFVPNLQPPPASPEQPSGGHSVFWVQGLNVGLELTY